MKFEFDIKKTNIKRRIEQIEKHKKSAFVKVNDKRFIEYENGIVKRCCFDNLKDKISVKQAFFNLTSGKIIIETKSNILPKKTGGIAYLIDYLIMTNTKQYISGNAEYERILKLINKAIKLKISKNISSTTKMVLFNFEKTNIFVYYYDNKVILAEFEKRASFNYIKNKIKKLIK